MPGCHGNKYLIYIWGTEAPRGLNSDAPATLMSTVHEVLCQTVRFMEALSFETTVIFLGQALYARALKLLGSIPICFKMTIFGSRQSILHEH